MLLAAIAAVAALIAGCTIGDGGTSPGGAGPSAEASPVAVVTQNPAAGAVDVSPVAPISVTVTDGTLREIALTNPDGKLVQGELALEQASYTITEPDVHLDRHRRRHRWQDRPGGRQLHHGHS